MKIKGYEVSEYVYNLDGDIEDKVEDIGDGYSIGKLKEGGLVLIENYGSDEEYIWKIVK